MRTFRIAKLLSEHQRRHNSWLALEGEIAAAHVRATGKKSARKPIDRRKLQKIAEGKPAPLYLREFEALDDYLREFHQSLTHLSLFEHSTLTSTLGAHAKVHCLIGARQFFQTISVSHHDTLAYATLERILNKQGPRVASDLHTVLVRKTREDAQAIEEAYRPLLDEEAAVVSIASPIANHGTELMLARMFRCRSFQEASTSRRKEIAFVVPADQSQGMFSSFVEGPEELRELDAELACRVTQRRWALRVGDEVFLASPEEERERAKTYGLILAQRRANGHLWVALAGLHGAGTYAAALALDGAEMSPEAGARGADGLIHLRVVEAILGPSSVADEGTPLGEVQEARILTQFNRSYDPRSMNGGDSRRVANDGPF